MNSFVSVGFVIIINPQKYVNICCLHCTCIDEIKKIMMMDQTFINNNLTDVTEYYPDTMSHIANLAEIKSMLYCDMCVYRFPIKHLHTT